MMGIVASKKTSKFLRDTVCVSVLESKFCSLFSFYMKFADSLLHKKLICSAVPIVASTSVLVL